MALRTACWVALLGLPSGCPQETPVGPASGRPVRSPIGPAVGLAVNHSVRTQCAEEDNVSVAFHAKGLRQFRLTASHPRYEIGTDNCRPDFTNCPESLTRGPRLKPDEFRKLFDDGRTVVELCTVDRWWRGQPMRVDVGGVNQTGHYVRIYRRTPGEIGYPQLLVVYQDAHVRLKSHPPRGRQDTCFGSSFLVGPARPGPRPYVDVERIDVLPGREAVQLEISYAGGQGRARLRLSADRAAARLDVDVHYAHDQQIAFGMFRSMWVADGNADVDRVAIPAEKPKSGGPQEWRPAKCILDWERLSASQWFFHRAVRSRHNTSAPDLRVELIR